VQYLGINTLNCRLCERGGDLGGGGAAVERRGESKDHLSEDPLHHLHVRGKKGHPPRTSLERSPATTSLAPLSMHILIIHLDFTYLN
jgi:hypothetical protein